MSKNNKYSIGISTLVISMVFASSVVASFDVKSWKYFRDLNVPENSDFVKVTLPDNVSSGGNDFSDIRIMTQSDSVEVPYFITRNAIVRSGEINGQILDQTISHSGQVSFILDTGEQGVIHTGLSISNSSPNFRRQVSVYSSPSQLALNDNSWNFVTDKGFIFKFTDPNTKYASGKNTIDIPANTSRYLKVVISAGPEGQVLVGGATIYGETRIDVPSYNNEVSVSLFNNPKNKATEVTLDLGESGRITNSITFSSNDHNYSRRVIVESSDNASSTWNYVGEGSISNVTTSLFTGTYLTVVYPEQKTRFIRASIVNDDNRPLNIGNVVNVEGPIVSAIFEMRPNESYRLYYSNPNAQTPVYDISRISTYIETNKLPQASLGDESLNPLYVTPAAPAVPFTESNRSVLNVFLVIIVIIIGAGIAWYLYLFMKRKGSPYGFDMTDNGEEK